MQFRDLECSSDYIMFHRSESSAMPKGFSEVQNAIKAVYLRVKIIVEYGQQTDRTMERLKLFKKEKKVLACEFC